MTQSLWGWSVDVSVVASVGVRRTLVLTFNSREGSYECSCKPGFESLGFDCGDIDECLSAPCDEFAFCTNLPGSFKCQCKSGYSGDGIKCDDVNECDNNPCQNAECINNNGSFICSCYTGLG